MNRPCTTSQHISATPGNRNVSSPTKETPPGPKCAAWFTSICSKNTTSHSSLPPSTPQPRLELRPAVKAVLNGMLEKKQSVVSIWFAWLDLFPDLFLHCLGMLRKSIAMSTKGIASHWRVLNNAMKSRRFSSGCLVALAAQTHPLPAQACPAAVKQWDITCEGC